MNEENPTLRLIVLEQLLRYSIRLRILFRERACRGLRRRHRDRRIRRLRVVLRRCRRLWCSRRIGHRGLGLLFKRWLLIARSRCGRRDSGGLGRRDRRHGAGLALDVANGVLGKDVLAWLGLGNDNVGGFRVVELIYDGVDGWGGHGGGRGADGTVVLRILENKLAQEDELTCSTYIIEEVIALE